MDAIKLKNNYFNYDLAMRYLASNEVILKKVVSRFLDDYKNFLNEIEENTYEKIHSLKGITLNLGAEKLYLCSQNVLDSIKKGEDFDLQPFKYCFNMTYNELKAFIDEN